MYTLGQAAKATGKSKSTILRAIRESRLSYVGKNNKGYEIEPSELFRVFPKNDSQNSQSNNLEQSETAMKQSWLEEKVALLERRAEEYRQQMEHWQNEAAHWREQAQQSTRLLEDKREKKNLFRLFK